MSSASSRQYACLLAVPVFLATLLGGPRGAAAQFVVNTFVDAADYNLTDGRCDCIDDAVMAGDQCSLRAAIQNANLVTGPTTIILSAGTYGMTVSGGGENNCVAGDFDLLSSIEILGHPAGTTVIDASGLDRAFDQRTNHSVVIRDVTIRGGDPGIGSPPGTTSQHGGGIRQTAGSLVLERVILEGHVAQLAGPTQSDGGGIYSTAVLDLRAVTVRSNNCDGNGGGIYSNNTVFLTDCILSDNSAASAGGGLRLAGSASSVDLTRVVVRNNTANSGGGIQSNGSLVLLDCIIADNSALVGGGGGLNLVVGAADLRNCVISRNTAALFGGGVHSSAVGPAGGYGFRALDCTFRANRAAGSGGGLSNAGGALLEHCTLSGNTADGSSAADQGGGGIYNFVRTVELTNATISGNRAPFGRGGGILNVTNGVAVLNGVTLAFNSAAVGHSLHDGDSASTAFTVVTSTIISHQAPGPGILSTTGAIASGGFNLDSDGSGALTGPGDQSGTPFVPIDPLLAPLANNGGPTETHALNPGSPAIDRGTCTFVDAAGNVFTVGVDQRYGPRFIDGDLNGLLDCDVGAYEYQPVPTACATCRGDMNGDGRVDADDGQRFIACWFGGSPTAPGCDCSDMNGDGLYDPSLIDVRLFADKLVGVNDPNVACP